MMSKVKDFTKDIQAMEENYKGVQNQRMMGGYCWMLHRGDANHPHKRKSYVKHLKVFLI